MRVRARYAKAGKLRFVSAIDLGRIWERALRKANLPIAYSEGFTPHPKVSFPDALTLGYASIGEYVELTFAGRIDLPHAIEAFNRTAPEGLTVLSAAEVGDGAPRLGKWLRASAWDLRYSEGDAVELTNAVSALAHADRLPVERDRKGEVTRHDLRPALHGIASRELVVRAILHHTQPPMRPSEVHQALRTVTSPGAVSEPRLVIRIAQGQPTDDGLVEAISGELIQPVPEHQDLLRIV